MSAELAILAGLLGAADVAQGPTAEQVRVIESLARGYFGLDIDVKALNPIAPAELAAAIEAHDWRARHRAIDLLILVEFCRHPADPTQADRVEEYVGLLGSEDLAAVARDIQTGHREQAIADWKRFSEASKGLTGVDDSEVSSIVHGLAGCAAGTLGRGLYDFYVGHGLPFPGDPDGGDVTMAHHDFTHVITGYTPTPPDEVALQAMLTAASNFDHHFSGLVAALAALESATFELPGFVPREAVLDRPGAADRLADAFRRGSQCTGDFGAIDFMSRLNDLVVDVRAEYNIEAVSDDR
jgi:hypothetical protein